MPLKIKKENRDIFYKVLQDINKNDYLVRVADLNTYVENHPDLNTVGKYKEHTLINFALQNILKIIIHS